MKNTKSKTIAPLRSVSIPEGLADIFLLKNAHGMEATITNYGGILMSLKTADRDGVLENIVLGFDDPREYCTDSYFSENPYLGAIVGRNANVIRGGRFSLDGSESGLNKNFGDHNLHGGIKGFDKSIWEAIQTASHGTQTLELFRESPDGEEGFPGNLHITVTYELNDHNEFIIRFQASADRKTVMNFTQHSYFNLKGRSDILDHELMIDAASYVEFDKGLVPTGLIKTVDHTPMDFREPTTIGSRIKADFDQLIFGEGYDVNYALEETGKWNEHPAATVWEPETARFMELFTDLPGLQLYTGNSLNKRVKKGYKAWAGLCLEAQYFPDGPNHAHFKSGIFNAGQPYDHTIRWKFSVK
ncbi:MAG: aldose epimerase family protein [Chitinophagales bacterium]